MEQLLNSSHRHTHERVFAHPAVHDLQWRDVRSMLGAMGDLAEEANGNTKIVRNGHTLILRPSMNDGPVTVYDLMSIRRFLGRSEGKSAAVVPAGKHLLVVLDHREARVFQTDMRGSVPERITPHDPDLPGGSGRYLHNMGDDANGRRKPEVGSFYKAIAGALARAQQILIFGSGKGAASAMERLVASLRTHHKEIAARIVGSVVIDEHHLTEPQLMARARDFYASLDVAGGTVEQG